MKKIISIVIFCLMFIPMAQAATLFSQNTNSFYQNETKNLWPITVTAENNGEITALNGINLLIDSAEIQMLWDAVPALTATGTAVDHQKISATPSIQYLNNYSVLHIPLLADFTAGEAVTLSGMRLRSYHYSFGTRYIGLDITGDYKAEIYDVNKMEVTANALTDQTPPYPPTSFTATLSTDLKSVTLNWVRPPDYDLIYMILDRKLTRNGITNESNVFDNMNSANFVDTNIQVGDVITYKLYASDSKNFSDKVEQTVEVKAATPTTPPPAVEPPPATEKTEIDQLKSLYSYYKVRYAIKCRDASSSICLWAKIDLVYTQENIDKSDIKATLSSHEVDLIKSRIQWPESRYQTKCVDAATQDKTCPALEKSLKRAHYFID